MKVNKTKATITTETAISDIRCYNQPSVLNVISLGAGKQSTYMLLTALEGAYNGPYSSRPDFAIFSDTGCEPDYVYSYVEWLKDYVKTKYNFDIITVTAGNIVNDTIAYIEGKASRVAQLPLRLEGDGLVMRQCTNDYKIAPLRRYLQKIRDKRDVILWIGISLDECERVKSSNVGYIQNYYPLVEERVTISEIVHWFKKNGIKQTGKSACLISPFHSDQYWKRFKKQFPAEFEKACEFDDLIRDYPKLRKKAFLSKHLKPLREINFDYQPSLFPELIEECDGLCGL